MDMRYLSLKLKSLMLPRRLKVARQKLRETELEVLASYEIRNKLLMGGPVVSNHQQAVESATKFYSEAIDDYIEAHNLFDKLQEESKAGALHKPWYRKLT